MVTLKLIFTRPVVIPAVMGWYEGIGEYLKKQVGIGMTEHILFFQKGVIKSYRPSRQLAKVRRFIVSHPLLVLNELRLASELYKNL